MALDERTLPENPPVKSDGTNTLAGVFFMLVSGLGFTCSILIASSAIRGGIDVNTSNTLRYFVATVLLWGWQTANGNPLALKPLERVAALALGIAVFLMGAGYLGATRYIPVSLAVLIFYTGPFFIIIISRFTENEPITVWRLGAICIAFLGLILALGINAAESLPLTGILFAFLGAIGMAAFVTVSSLTIKNAAPQAVNLHSLFGGTLLFGLFLLAMGGPVGTVTPSGLLLLIGSGSAIAVGFITFFAGLRRVGPVKASILMNAEPVFTIALAAFMFGERLSSIQFVGACMVIAGIVMASSRP